MTAAVTIFALASGAGVAGVAVVRISGPRAFWALSAMTPGKARPKARMAVLRSLKDSGGAVLDDALVLGFEAPNSFTGEDVVELHLHGGTAVIESVLAALGAMEGLRLAEAGEFTRRAFEAGKLDLTAVEGLSDLIGAQTESQRIQALAQMNGALASRVEDWRTRLLDQLARLEADIEFPDEDLPDGITSELTPKVADLAREIGAFLNEGTRGALIRGGYKIALLGAPNAGKSSLINILVGSELAIVTDQAGTTRDIITATLDMRGFAVHIADTAGLRRADDKVEQIGVARARKVAEDAQLRLLLMAPDVALDAEEALELASGHVVLFTKADLDPMFHVKHQALKDVALAYFVLSTDSGTGLDALTDWLGAHVEKALGSGEAASITRARHADALEEVVKSLQDFGYMVMDDPVLAAEDLRLAVRTLGRITGRVGVEDMLDHLFSGFCIGK